jgi:hypothetical protein
MDNPAYSNSLRVMDEIIAHGFPRERGRLIHALVGGSQLHGVKLEGKDDHDIYGIYIETPQCCFWEAFPHFVMSTRRTAYAIRLAMWM